MASGTLQRIYQLPPGGFVRSSSGFFCRLPTGAVAFIPSVFRLPWHPDAARIVGPQEIAKLLRAEMIELSVGVVLLLAGIHYFFFDILNFYMAALSLPLAVLAHGVTMAVMVAGVFSVNNMGFACVRMRMVSKLPKAPGTVATDGLLLVRLTTAPPSGAGPLSVTVPVEKLPPTTLPGTNVRVLNAGAAGVTVRPAD